MIARQEKENKMYNKRDILTPGELTKLTDDVLSGLPTSKIKRLTTDEMHRIPEIYAGIDYSPDNLMEGTILDYLEDDKVYKTHNKKEVLGSDIKSITLLMYLRPRTAYWKPDKPQIHDTSVCGAVPLPLLGFKRYRGIPYYAWQRELCAEGFQPIVYFDDNDHPSSFILDKGRDIDWTEAECPIYAVDMLLGKTLASTTYNEKTDSIDYTKLGLVMLSFFDDEAFRPDYNDVHHFRAHNMGNFTGSFASAYGTAKVPEDWDEEEFDPHIVRYIMHNECTTPMRLMLSQRWAWYGLHRNTDMICDFLDWDNIPKSVDNMSVAMEGLKPKNLPQNLIRERFGLKT